MKRKPRVKLHFLEAHKNLTKHIPFMKELALPALKHITQLLPFKQPVDVVVHHEYYGRCGLTVSGEAPTGNVAYIHIDPARKYLRRELKKQLIGVLAHELHHTCRHQGPGCGKTLLEMIVSEGLACHFEEEITGVKSNVIPQRFSAEKLNRLYKRAGKEWDSKSYDHEAWFFGNERLKIPAQAGYILGYDLTAEAVEKYSASGLVHWSAKDIINP